MVDAAIQQLLEGIGRPQPDGLRVLSAYLGVPAEKGGRRKLASTVDSLLHEVRALLETDVLERPARLSLRRDIERLREAAHSNSWRPGGIAVFACSGAGVYEELWLPHVLRDRVMVDETAWVRPALAVLDEYHCACIALVERSFARFWKLYIEQLEELGELKNEQARVHGHPSLPGYEEYRSHRRIEEIERRHFEAVAEHLERLFAEKRFDVLILAGHEDELGHFEAYLSRDLRPRLAGSFAIDPRTATPLDIRQGSDRILERFERDEERRLVQETLEIAAMGGPAAVGLEDCLWAGSLEAIDLLLVHDEAAVAGVLCRRCGWLGTEGDACPVCGDPTRHAPDLIDELVEKVVEDSGRIEHVLARTELEQHLTAAKLRFPVERGAGGRVSPPAEGRAA